MFNPKIIFWFLVALLISTLSPDTIVKMFIVYWLFLVAFMSYTRIICWLAMRKGAVKVDLDGLGNSALEELIAREPINFGEISCEHRAHSIHCDTMRPGCGDVPCTCQPSHPADCGHCK